jgi:hypothetical protein
MNINRPARNTKQTTMSKKETITVQGTEVALLLQQIEKNYVPLHKQFC